MSKCVYCGTEIELLFKVGRQDECHNCRRDLHCCLQCKLYDRSAHNQCRESQSPYVSDKEKSNFCEFFEFGREVVDEQKAVDKAKRQLEELFKKT